MKRIINVLLKMMKDYYTIRVMSVWKFLTGVLVGTIIAVGVPMLIDSPLSNYSYLLFLAWVVACMALGYIILKKVAVTTLLVNLTEEELIIQSTQMQIEKVVNLDDVASFLYQKFNGNTTFRLRLHSGQKIQFGHNDTFCADDDLPALVANFKKHIARRATETNETNKTVIKREKTFFERPVASVLGWIIVVALVGFTIQLLLHGVKDGKWGSLFLIYGNGLTYLGAWMNARRNGQNQ